MKTINYIVLARANPDKDDTIQVFRVRGSRILHVGEAAKGYRDTAQAACDIIAGHVKGMARFPRKFVPPPHATLSKDRTMLHYSSGMSHNYPAFLYDETDHGRSGILFTDLRVPMGKHWTVV